MDEQDLNSADEAAPDESSEQQVDIASLERDIDSLMSTARTERPTPDGGGNNQVDLLLKEINELLAHETNSLLTATNGLLGKTLESIFDPKILANKHQKIDKALAAALAKGKAGAAAAVKAPVTNPAPRFAGISRPMTADLSKTGIKSAAQQKIASGPREALPTPEEEEPGAVKFGEAPKGDTGAVTTRIEEKPPEPEPVVTIEEAKPAREPTPKPEPVAEKPPAPAPAPAPETAPKPAEKPKAEAPPKEPAPAATPAEVPDFPQPLILRILALPMKFVPQSAHLAVSAVALTMLFSAPIAWVLAHRAANTQGIGPIDFSVLAAEQAESAQAAKEASKEASKESSKESSKEASKEASKESSKAGAAK